MATFVYVIFGMIKFLVKNSTVSEIRYAPVLGMYALWHMYCSKAGPMYQPGSPRDDHDILSFGLLWITTIVFVGDSGVQL